MTLHEQYMLRCIELARLGAGSVAPNPMVGSVLVWEGRIIGEGYHRQYGQPHAEVNCLRDAAERFGAGEEGRSFQEILQHSTLYVSLEPCAHFGKTPPCADLIIEKKIPRVVVGCRDPFPLVAGKGIEKLEAAGAEVITGVLEQTCKELNSRFFTYHLQHRPYIVLKWAQSRNGKIAAAGPERTLISGEITNRLVHRWRSEEFAILVGTGTALADDPSLTNRLWTGKHPLRLVLDLSLRLPRSLKLFGDGSRTVVFNHHKQDGTGPVEYAKLDPQQPLIEELLTAMHRLNIQSVLVEGGARMLQSFIAAQAWDEARVITNQELEIGEGTDAPVLHDAVRWQSVSYGKDEVVMYRPGEKERTKWQEEA